MKPGKVVIAPTGLQTRLALLVLVALLPVWWLIIYTIVHVQQKNMERAHEDLLGTAKPQVLKHEQAMESTRQLLQAIANTPLLLPC